MLYLVSTPIGNLGDISFRAIDILKKCDYILAEDTRQSLKLLSHYEISKKVVSFHEFNEKEKEESVIEDLLQGRTIALVSDAGTPLISDPGAFLVMRAKKEGIRVENIPGPCAVIAALCVSGLKVIPFQFIGFLPRKKNELRSCFEKALDFSGTTIAYESPERLVDSLIELVELCPRAAVCVARELTKKFETVLTAPAKELLEQLQKHPVKGEIVLLFEGGKKEEKKVLSDEEIREHVVAFQNEQQCSLSDASKEVAEQLGLPRRKVYQIMHQGNI